MPHTFEYTFYQRYILGRGVNKRARIVQIDNIFTRRKKKKSLEAHYKAHFDHKPSPMTVIKVSKPTLRDRPIPDEKYITTLTDYTLTPLEPKMDRLEDFYMYRKRGKIVTEEYIRRCFRQFGLEVTW